MVNCIVALLRSKIKTLRTESFSNAFKISLVKVVIALMVECFSRKQYWSLFNVLFPCTQSYALLCTTVPNIFKIDGNNDIGLERI